MHLVLLIFLSISIVHGTDKTMWSSEIESYVNKRQATTFPNNLDWRTKSVVTPVQDYSNTPYMAGSVMVETIESLHAIATGNLQRGSIARVIDCCTNSSISYDCIQQIGGICTYDDYPTILNNCQANACKPFASFNTVSSFQGQNDSALLPLIQISTLYVSMDTSQQSFLQYKGGIYNEQNCSQNTYTGALQLVGYGSTDSGDSYWIARNNQGQDWGESGYIRILSGENICGFGSQMYQPALLAITTTTTVITTTIPTTKLSRSDKLYFSLNKFLFILFQLISFSYL